MASQAETMGMVNNAPVPGSQPQGSSVQKTINCVKALKDASPETYHKYFR